MNAAAQTYFNQPVATADQTKERLDAFIETFHSMTHDPINGYSYAYDSMLLPYFPYFSKCYGYDRYMPIWMVFESDQCALPDHDPATGLAHPHKVRKSDATDVFLMYTLLLISSDCCYA